MLEFVKNAFSRSLEVRLWFNLVVTAIVGAVAWHSFWLPGRAFIGLLIGIGVGLWSNIAFGGLMATVVVTSEKLEQMNRKIEQLENILKTGSDGTIRVNNDVPVFRANAEQLESKSKADTSMYVNNDLPAFKARFD